MRRWRKMTWAIVIWTVLMAVWIFGGISGASGVACDPSLAQSTCDAARAVGTGIGVSMLFFLWLIGFLVLAVIWFMTRPKDNVVVYGPSGQQVTVSEKEAQRRVERDGWSYQRQ